MSGLSEKNFGLLMAYVVPGFVVLWGASGFSSTVESWITGSPQNGTTVAGLLCVTLASLAVGLTVSALRWMVVDRLHHLTGLQPPECDFGNLEGRLQGFLLLVESHYRYYQFYANLFVAVALAYAQCLAWPHGSVCGGGWRLASVVLLEMVLLAGSRDALRKYYRRVERLLGTLETPDERSHHDQRYRQEEGSGGEVAQEETESRTEASGTTEGRGS